MSVKFGRIKNYKDRGFGFIENDEPDVFFHIKTLFNSPIKEKLENNSWEFEDIYLWYTTKEDSKGTFADNIWSNIKEIPQPEIETYLQIHIDNNVNGHSIYFEKALKEIFSCFDIFASNNKIDLIIRKLLQKDYITRSPYNISKLLPEIYKKYFAEILNLESYWNDNNIPYWLETTTEELLGKELLNDFKKNREKKLIQLQQQKEKEKLSKLQDLITKYKNKPEGIRNEFSLREVCIECGSTNVHSRNESQHYFKVCQDCKTEWYVNHCWNCSARVDSRDIQNPKCSTCGWLKCTCGACNYGGCATNPYSKDNKLKNMKKDNSKTFDDIDDYSNRETCDWCDSPNVTHRDEAYTLCENCSDQLFGD